ncbi:hybrid sensor histidine kinase/response regulator [Gloeocapsopsis dulcis]|uniref:histidine kinase n=1 Tax=Gloeocapsopsis dulcis AAB1 = 1H9 TaxID=1433147 RepID=A0A6N8FP25_9CHRO|nr:PAS domain-containing sensor histidine kinase [Gloeocapsopsis dulcis]MUL35053.1 hybrid sensor histidine kinase/response regulator [Gloeocapsopsis dulcis AAB1 = 1H9]WNN89869.1 response regulator [Gloeocapsopsis dulcis]
MDYNTIRVLLVDDDEDDYVLTRDWFLDQGNSFELEWVASYDAALTAIAQNRHDVYLLDYRLGDRNGLELLREAMLRGCNAPMILLTGQGDHEIDVEAMKAGAADYLEKSQITAYALERSIRYALERKRTEQKIREQAALLDVATDAICVQALDSTILFWNKGAERLYGWTAADALGTKASELLYVDVPPQLTAAQKIVVSQGEWRGQLAQITQSGAEVIVESRWTLVRNEQGQPKSILVVNTDITEKKQLEAQFLRAQRMESLGTLASGIAHDLNNILAPILMTAQLLETQVHDERSQRLLPILIANAKRGAALVKQVLSFAKGLEGKRSVLQLRHIISEIKQITKETFPKSIEICIDVPQSLWTISGDATQLHQVLMNLCVNARDAMLEGGTLTISAENLEVDQSYVRKNLDAKVGSYVVLTIADTGCGIPPEVMDRIFEPFFTTKEIGKGTGLGLSTVIGIVKSHGGFVNVASEIGKGTRFQIYLPAVEAVEMVEVENLELPQGHGELILVVDDEAPIRETTKTSLETYNYRAVTASNGIEAVALYAEYRDEVSVVITDMLMPAMDGPTTIRTLQKMNPMVKVIAVSGLASKDKMNTIAAAGVKSFLSKPFTTQELLQTIDGILHPNKQISSTTQLHTLF